jgi:acid phosphatase
LTRPARVDPRGRTVNLPAFAHANKPPRARADSKHDIEAEYGHVTVTAASFRSPESQPRQDMTQLRPLLPLLVAVLFPLAGCSTMESLAKPGASSPGKVSAAATPAPAANTPAAETAPATTTTAPATEAAPAAAPEPAPAETPSAPAEAAPAAGAAVPADDMLDATYWMQHSVEYEGSTTTAFELAKLRLDAALKDKKWTALPDTQKGNLAKLPVAVICDVDETLLDNSAYQAWNITSGMPFSNETWGKFVQSETSKAVPGAIDFAKYAAAKNVTVFYVSNRLEEGEQATRDNMKKLGFPMGGKVDTFLMLGEKDEWTSRKSSRFAFIAKKYRVALLLGDNFGDFTDAYKGSEADRQKVYDQNLKHWGYDWIVLPNPSYGSFEAVPYQFNYQASPEEMRDDKRKALTSWDGQ